MTSCVAPVLRILASISLLAVAGCTFLPNDGPLGSSINSGAAAAKVGSEAGENLPYAVVDLRTSIVRVIPAHGPSRLNRSFGLGKGRPPVTKITIGDTILVTIFESAEGGLFLTAGQVGRTGNYVQIPAQTVDSSGSIYVPFAGNVKVTGRTLSEVSREIEGKLQARAIEPKVVVSIQSREDNRVSVLGEVGNPTQVPININGDRVLDVIAKAGGIKNPGYESYVQISRGGHTEAVYFDAIVDNSKENIYVKPNDTVYVYREQQSFVALGAFAGDQQIISRKIPFETASLNLAEAIGKAGGLNDVKADPNQVLIFRLEERRSLEKMGVNLENIPNSYAIVPTIYRASLRDPSIMFTAQSFRMRDKDVVYVADAGSAELSKFLKVAAEVAGTVAIADATARLVNY